MKSGRQIYYREKVINLVNKIFIETGDARSRIINCEKQIDVATSASLDDETPIEVRERWQQIWDELNVEYDWYTKSGKLIESSLSSTVRKKRNKSMEKYLLFFLEEYNRVI